MATKIYKSLADINPGFMKPYFKITEMPHNLRNGYALKLPSTNSTYMELTQSCSEHVHLYKAVSHCLNSNPKWKFKEILSALVRYVGHGFVIMYYEQIPL